MKTRRILVLLIVTFLLVGTMPGSAFAEQSSNNLDTAPLGSSFLDEDQQTLTSTEVEVSNFAEFKQAVLEAEAYVQGLPEGETAETLTITLLDDITIEETLTADNSAFVQVLAGEKLVVRSKEGEKHSIIIKNKPSTWRCAAFTLCNGNSSLSLKDVILKLNGCAAVYSYVLETVDLSELPQSELNVDNCEIVNIGTKDLQYVYYLCNCIYTISNCDKIIPRCTSAFLMQRNSVLNVNNCIFENPISDMSYLAIYNSSLNMENSVISGFDRTINSVSVRLITPSAIALSSGNVEITNCRFSKNRGFTGGAIFAVRSTGTITNTEFSENKAELPIKNSDGGAALKVQNNSHITLNNCVFKNNYCDLSGGAIQVFHGSTVEINGGEISENVAETHGGAICIADAFSSAVSDQTVSKVYLNGVKVKNNIAKGNNDGNPHNSDPYAKGGGALFAHGNCQILLENGTTVTDNIAQNDGNGGGVFVCYAGVLSVDKASITENTATGNGGGVYLDGAASYEGITHTHPSVIPLDSGFGSGANMYLKDGLISGNNAVQGGGVYINGNNMVEGTEYTGGTLIMDKGVITANHASGYGGGICMSKAESGETGASFLMNDGALYFNVSGANGNTDDSGAGAELYSEGNNSKVTVRTAGEITSYIQNTENKYVPEKDRNVWFLNWYDDFSESRYMTLPVLERNIYSPKSQDMDNLALILDRSTALSVTKQVVGDSAPDDKAFGFTLSLTGLPQNEKYPVEISSESGETSSEQMVTDGKLNFTLKAGETFTIKELPAGTKFKVKETEKQGAEDFRVKANDVESFAADSWTVSGKTRSTWTGSTEYNDSEVTFINLYDSDDGYNETDTHRPTEEATDQPDDPADDPLDDPADDPEDEPTETEPDEPTDTEPETPKTGDDMPILPWVILMIAGFAGLRFLLPAKKH